jgi:signal transduction histidine kinase
VGLLVALQSQAQKATLPITIGADGIGRYPQDTESALYFCVLEARQNTQKYAQAPSATVCLRETGNQLTVEVVDSGRGFYVSTTILGDGLTNMEDRLDALGGTMNIASSPGNGTMLRATVPLKAVVSKVFA